MSVSTKPGATATERMPCGANATERLCQCVQPRLAGAVGGRNGFTAIRATRTHADQTPAVRAAVAVQQVVDRQPSQIRRSHQIEVKGFLPGLLPAGVAGRIDLVRHVHAGVVDQHVEISQTVDDLSDDAGADVRGGEVAADDGVRAAGQLIPHPLGGRSVSPGVHRDAMPGRCERLRHRGADATVRSRHQAACRHRRDATAL
jgi:hypothetical protein